MTIFGYSFCWRVNNKDGSGHMINKNLKALLKLKADITEGGKKKGYDCSYGTPYPYFYKFADKKKVGA